MSSGMMFLFLGLTAFWLVLASYLWSLGARQKRLADDVALLADVLEEKRGRM